MSEFATHAGLAYLDGVYETSGLALTGVMQDARGNQFEVSRLIGEILAVHDTQDALLWRTSLRKSGAHTVTLDVLVAPSIEILRELRSRILALGIDEDTQGILELRLSEVHGGVDAQKKNLKLEEVE